MKKETNISQIYKRIIITLIATLCLITVLVMKKHSYEIISSVYIVILISIIVLCSCLSLLFLVTDVREKIKYWFYQICDFISMLTIAILILEIIFTFWFFPSCVQQTSMTPTLPDGKRVIVNVAANPERFDVVVVECDDELNNGVISYEAFIDNKNSYLDRYHNLDNYDEPIHDGSLLIKRLIGMPGDSFYFDENSNLYINGEYYDEAYLKDENGEFLIGQIEGTFKTYDTTTTEFSYGIIPEGYYFVMGDNRGHSSDSRVFGLFHESQIVGTVTYQFDGLFKLRKVS